MICPQIGTAALKGLRHTKFLALTQNRPNFRFFVAFFSPSRNMFRRMPVMGGEINNHRVVTLVVFYSESVFFFFSVGVVELIKRSSSSRRRRRRKNEIRGAPLHYRQTQYGSLYACHRP